MGRRPKPRGRDVHGVVLLDKPLGLSSNQALQKVKRLFNANRAGHTGSLDPMATGLLPICLGEATKVSAYLLDATKAYTARMQLGQRTNTGDREGEVVEERPIPAGWQQKLEQQLPAFLGEQEQVPPMYSALKVEGKPLYKLAREGVEVERKRRKITIHKLVLLEVGADWAEFYVRCSKGTYVRTLAEDLGEALGCGAHLSMLRRCEVAPYDEAKMVTLEALEAASERGLDVIDECLLPVDSALSAWPRVALEESLARRYSNGQAISGVEASPGWYRVYLGETLLGLGEVDSEGQLKPRRQLHLGAFLQPE